MNGGQWTMDDGHEILSHALRTIFGMSESRNVFLVKFNFLFFVFDIDNANVTQ